MAEVLLHLRLPPSSVDQTKEVFSGQPKIPEAFCAAFDGGKSTPAIAGDATRIKKEARSKRMIKIPKLAILRNRNNLVSTCQRYEKYS
jgi:hypothetical protein